MHDNIEFKAARDAAARGDFSLFEQVAIRASTLLISTGPGFGGTREDIDSDRRALSCALRDARGFPCPVEPSRG